jgi:two-component system sensor histidine kinase/response regulator
MTSGPILIVEDNQVNALILRAMLRKHGYEPVVAADGLEGVALSEQHRPLLILMDLQMPRLDGFGAAAEINRNAGETTPVIVAVTANASADIRAACYAAGFAGVLAKPVVLEELIETVRRYVPANGRQ